MSTYYFFSLLCITLHDEGKKRTLWRRNPIVTGHAFDARIYAENVSKGFLPVTGILHHYRPVPVSSTVWVETRVEQGDTVSMHYDPMIAKLVVWGENWVVALVKMKDCLSKFQVAGLPTNINFLQKLANH
ncbi:hypothetical protein VitviT2T_022979 [Vitis vinifera]|uniref:Biotin carboxylation domain-containing protein n=2 Tax=Vitis vinifera TaxID=29760 RepID=A0ABY9DCS7_VITVI